MSGFDFNFIERRYDSARLNEEILWPLVDQTSNRGWREEATPGEEHIVSHHSERYYGRLAVSCSEFQLVTVGEDGQEIEPVSNTIDKTKINCAGISITEYLDDEKMLANKIEAIESDQAKEKLREAEGLKLGKVWVANFNDAGLPSVMSNYSIFDQVFARIYEGPDVYSKAVNEDEIEGLPPSFVFGDYEMQMVSIGLSVLKAAPEIVQKFREIKDNPLQ